MAKLQIEADFVHNRKNKSRHVSCVVPAKKKNTDEVWKELALLTGNTIKRVKQDWDVKNGFHVDYYDLPWDDFMEIKGWLESLADVSNVRYESPYRQPYREPRFHVRLDKDRSIESEVTNYYDGLTAKKQSDSYYHVIAYMFD